MEIKLKVKRLVNDIRSKSHFTVATIADPSARYNAEAGSDKTAEILRDISDAVSSAVQQCYRFMDSPGIDVADDMMTLLDEGEVVFTFPGIGARRMDGKEKALADKLHAIVVSLALQKYYLSVAQAELSKTYAVTAISGMQELEALLRQKRPPKFLDLEL